MHRLDSGRWTRSCRLGATMRWTRKRACSRSMALAGSTLQRRIDRRIHLHRQEQRSTGLQILMAVVEAVLNSM